MNIDKIKPGKDIPNDINVVVEIPKGSQNKYELDKESGAIMLDRVLFSPMVYPGDYGFVPRTLAKDGDPLDALVFVTHPTFPGVVINARPIGVMKMIDQGEEDDKIICVPVDDPRFSHLTDLDQVAQPLLDEIGHFFETYKHLEGKKVEVGEWLGVAEAKKIIEECVKAYQA